MPILPWRKKLYRLKGRSPEGSWEILQEFDEPVRYRDISEDLKEYLDAGYDYFYLEECDEKGRNCKRKWSYRPRKRPEKQLSEDVVKKLEEYEKLKKMIQEKLGIREPNPEDLIATYLYYRSILEETFKALGVPEDQIQEILTGKKTSSGSMGELKELFELLNMFRQYSPMPGYMPMNPYMMNPYNMPMNPYPMNNPVSNPGNQVSTGNIENQPQFPVQTIPENIQQKASEIVEKALQKTEEALMPPCMKEGVCIEEGGE